MKVLLGIALALSSAAWATPIPIFGWAGVGGDSSDFCFTAGPNFTATVGCTPDGQPGKFLYFSEAGPGSLYFAAAGEDFDTTHTIDFSHNLLVQYYSSDVTASNGVITASHHDYYPSELGYASGQIAWTAEPVEFTQPYQFESVQTPITVVGIVQAWTAEEWASGKPPFFNYQVKGAGTLTAFPFWGPNVPYLWGVGIAEFRGTAEAVPEPSTWLLALGLCALPVIQRRRKSSA